MSIIIDKAKWKGCGMCTSVCPGSLIYQDSEKKAFIKYPKDCWGCASCIKECHFGAIALYLGATEARKRFLSTRRNPINIKEKDRNRHG